MVTLRNAGLLIWLHIWLWWVGRQAERHSTSQWPTEDNKRLLFFCVTRNLTSGSLGLVQLVKNGIKELDFVLHQT